MTLVLILLGLAFAAVTALAYATFCYLAPFGRCRRCRARWAAQPLCRRCDGTGHRVRLGIRAWQAWTRTTRDAFRDYPTSLTNPTTEPTNPTTDATTVEHEESSR